MMRVVGQLWVTVVVALAVPWGAPAYEIATTDNEEQYLLHWDTRLVPFNIQLHGGEGVEPDDLEAALIAAFRSWGEVPEAAVLFYQDFSEADRVAEADSRNVLFWTEESWKHDRAVIALTSINYYPDTGIIADADIDFNGKDYTWTVTDTAVRIDVQAIATHEIGHMVGIDHTEDDLAAMYAYYDVTPAGVGETRQRVLNGDDKAAIAYLYPCEELRVVGGDRSVVGTELDCAEAFFEWPEYADEGGPHTATCASSRGRAGLWVTGLLALALALVRRERLARLPLLAWVAVMVLSPVRSDVLANITPWADLDRSGAQADAVVRGEVTSVEPVWSEDGHVHSLVEIRVDEWLAGDGPTHLVLERPSGVMASMGTYVPGDPRFAIGQDVILLLADHVDGTPGLVGMSHGFLEVVDVDGVPAVRRQPGPEGGTEWYPLEALQNHLRRR